MTNDPVHTFCWGLTVCKSTPTGTHAYPNSYTDLNEIDGWIDPQKSLDL